MHFLGVVCWVFIHFNNWVSAAAFQRFANSQGNLTYNCKFTVIRSFVGVVKCRIETGAAFGQDLGGLIHFEMIYRSIFNCCSRHQRRPSLLSTLIIVGMSEIHFAINCPHVVEVYKSCFHRGRNSGGEAEEECPVE